MKNNYFCFKNNGRRKNPIKAGSKRWTEKNGLFDFRYPTSDPKYKHPPKLEEFQKTLLNY